MKIVKPVVTTSKEGNESLKCSHGSSCRIAVACLKQSKYQEYDIHS